MKKAVISILILTVLLACSACGKKADTASDGQQTDADTAADEQQTDSAITTDVMQQVGTDALGYVSIPNDWVPYESETESTALQYASADSRVVISLDLIDKSDLSDEEKEKLTAESAAQGIWSTFEQGGVKEIKGAKVQLADCDAFQVYGVYTQGADDTAGVIVSWVFESEDGAIHVVTAEGATEAVMDGVTQIEATYRLTAE